MRLKAARSVALAELSDELELEGSSEDESAALGWPNRQVAEGMRVALGVQLGV